MRHWQQLSIEDRLDVIEITSAKKHLPQLAVDGENGAFPPTRTVQSIHY